MREEGLLLLPYPQRVHRLDGVLHLPGSATLPIERHISERMSHPEGYLLSITPDAIHIDALSEAGLFYAEQTVKQLVAQFGRDLPLLEIEDWPDFLARGFLLDISRNKVPQMPELLALVDRLAGWKINQLQLYTEHTFAYSQHETVWRDASPMTADQIRELDAYCRARFVELVPNQNSFGHLSRWLKHEPYRHLAEAPEGCMTVWGWEDAFSVAPTAESLAFLASLYDELLPNFTSRQFNVGCDETVDLGKGRSREHVAAQGEGRVYLDFLLQIYANVKARGLTMQFWGDIIMNHPELTPELPRDVVALEWGYEADHPFDDHGRLFAASGIPFYVCPGTSSWRALVPRYRNAVQNLRSAAVNGRYHGAIGYLITDWGDEGHLQPFSASLLPLGIGAALAWAQDTNDDDDVLALAAALHAFGDDSGETAVFLRDLGNVHLLLDRPHPNESVLFSALQATRAEILARLGADRDAVLERVELALERIRQTRAGLVDAPLTCPDADLVRAELFWAADMLSHACRRIQWAAGRRDGAELIPEAAALIREFDAVWHARNRPGGFADSMARLERMAADYAVPSQEIE